jgi:MFS family permease
MANEKVMNRWNVVPAAVLIQLCLGAIYAWSVFTVRITAADGAYGFSAKQAAWIFSVGLAVFAIVMIFAGRWQMTVGPRKVCAAGGIVLGLGYILAAFIGGSFGGQMLGIGIIGGAGIGLAYVVPIAVAMRWFPDKKGMITGLAVAGFGFGATIWVKWAGAWGGGLLNTLNLFGLDGVRSVFFLYGLIFMIAVLIGSYFMVFPPDGWLPEGYTPPAPKESSTTASGTEEFEPSEMRKTPQFYMVWVTFILSALAGLMVIYCIRLFGVDALTVKLGDKASAAKAAGTAMALYAILNGLGRIVWGTVSDWIGRRNAVTAMCAFQGIIMLAFFSMGQTVMGLTLGAMIIGFNFGGNFALFPTTTADLFGTKNVGPNYGWVFTAYGVAGILGPQIAGWFKDAAAGAGVAAWKTPFIIAGVGCLIGAAIAFSTKPPHH